MKKTFFILSIITLLSVSSCNKGTDSVKSTDVIDNNTKESLETESDLYQDTPLDEIKIETNESLENLNIDPSESDESPANNTVFETNEYGLAYGTGLEDEELDLIKVVGIDGKEGYVYRSQIVSEPVKGEVLQQHSKKIKVPVYEIDGKTIIDYFETYIYIYVYKNEE